MNAWLDVDVGQALCKLAQRRRHRCRDGARFIHLMEALPPAALLALPFESCLAEDGPVVQRWRLVSALLATMCHARILGARNGRLGVLLPKVLARYPFGGHHCCWDAGSGVVQDQIGVDADGAVPRVGFTV